jgi:predicted adenine nucleotide alpha hydrolase (AANH) superfamily ATPase
MQELRTIALAIKKVVYRLYADEYCGCGVQSANTRRIQKTSKDPSKGSIDAFMPIVLSMQDR